MNNETIDYTKLSMQELGLEIAKNGLHFIQDSPALTEWLARVGGEANGLINQEDMINYMHERWREHVKLFRWVHARLTPQQVDFLGRAACALWVYDNAIPVEEKKILAGLAQGY